MGSNNNGGRKRVPTHLRIIRGNPSQRPFNKREPKPELVCPSPPAHLSEKAKAVWEDIAKRLFDTGVLSTLDTAALEALAEAMADFRAAREVVEREGQVFEHEGANGQITMKVHPAMTVVADADRRIRAWLTEFGMTPSSRSKVSVAAPDGVEDPAEKYFA